MPAVPWTTDRQRTFIQNHVSSYCAAVNEGKKAIRRFWPIIMGEFFEAFPLKQELVDKGALGGHVVEESYDLTPEESAVFQDAMDKRTGQIKTLFRYLEKKESVKGDASERGKSKSAGSKLIATAAAKAFVSKQRRCHHQTETFYRLNKDWLDKMIQDEMASLATRGPADAIEVDDEESGEEGDEEQRKHVLAGKDEAKRRGWNLKVRNTVIKRHFDAASPDDLRAVSEAIIQEKEEIERAADLDRSGRGLARDPALRKDALENANSFLIANAKAYWDYAGMASITVGIASDPDQPEKLRTRVVAYGRDINGQVITDVDPTLAGKIVKQLRGWAKASVFTPENFALAAAEHKEYLRKLEGSGEGSDDEVEETRGPKAGSSATSPPAKPNLRKLEGSGDGSDSEVEEIEGPKKGSPATLPPAKPTPPVAKPTLPLPKPKPTQSPTTNPQKQPTGRPVAHRIVSLAGATGTKSQDTKAAADASASVTQPSKTPSDIIVHPPSTQPPSKVTDSKKRDTAQRDPGHEDPRTRKDGSDDEDDGNEDDDGAIEDHDPEYRDAVQSFGKPTDEDEDDPEPDVVEENDLDKAQDSNYEGGDHDEEHDGDHVEKRGEDHEMDHDEAKGGEHTGEKGAKEDRGALPFDGAAFWARLETNIPDTGKEHNGSTNTGPTKSAQPGKATTKPKPKPKPRVTKGGKGAKGTVGSAPPPTPSSEALSNPAPASEALPDPTPAPDALTNPAPASYALTHPAPASEALTNPDALHPDSVDATEGQTGKKRKVPPVAVPEVEDQGRPKRARNPKTLDDGTVFSRPSRRVKDAAAKMTGGNTATEVKSARGGKAVGEGPKSRSKRK